MHTCTHAHTHAHTHTCACTCTPTHQHAYVWMGTLCVLSTREHLSGVRLCLCVFRNTCIELKDGRVDKRSRRVLQGPLNNYRRRYLVVYARIGPRQAQCGRCTMLSSEGTSELEFNAFVCGGALYAPCTIGPFQQLALPVLTPLEPRVTERVSFSIAIDSIRLRRVRRSLPYSRARRDAMGDGRHVRYR